MQLICWVALYALGQTPFFLSFLSLIVIFRRMKLWKSVVNIFYFCRSASRSIRTKPITLLKHDSNHMKVLSPLLPQENYQVDLSLLYTISPWTSTSTTHSATTVLSKEQLTFKPVDCLVIHKVTHCTSSCCLPSQSTISLICISLK